MTSFDLEAWAATVRMTSFPRAKEPGDILVLGDMDSTVSLADRAGNFVVETSSRGGRRKLIGAFSKREDAVRTIVYWIGSGNSGRDPGSDADFAGAMLDESPISTHLDWPGGSAEFGPGVTGSLWARRFNWTREKTPEQVAAAF
jgi:hypothetical protein